MTKAWHPNIGSISTGTLRTEDLLPVFFDTLTSIKDNLCADNPDVRAMIKLLARIEARMDKASYYTSGKAEEDLEALTEELESYAPPYTHFGSHEGDGADFGFWISWDSIEEAARDGELVKVDAGDEWPASAADAQFVLEVNDHGNATLFSALTKEEVWSVV